MHTTKGQTWSLDLIIAVVIFIVILTLFYTLLVREPKADTNLLKKEGQYLSERVKVGAGAGTCSFIKDKTIDPSKLRDCYLSDKDAFKKENNLQSKFCIYITDQSGHLITIDNRTGFGYSDLNLSGTPCGTPKTTWP